jgi:propanediol utilization protein
VPPILFLLLCKGLTIPVEGYPGIVGVSAKGKVFEGEQVPVNKRMMEKEDAEQVSEEERKRLGGKVVSRCCPP